MKVYLDIDGVLVMHSQKTPYSDEFIKFLVENFDCYWLSTNVKGNTDFVLNRLKDIFSPKTMEYIKKIKPTDWKTLKTEAINLNEDFWWFDDFVLQKEREILKEKNKSNRLILIRLKEFHWTLKDYLDFYKEKGELCSLDDGVTWKPINE